MSNRKKFPEIANSISGDRVFKACNLAITYYVWAAFVVAAVGSVLVMGLPHFAESLLMSEILFAIHLSLATSLISTVICLLVSLPVAYTLARYRIPGRAVINTIIDIPLALTPLISGVCLLLLFGATPLGRFLEEVGIKFIFTVQGIILDQFFVILPYMIKTLETTIKGIDPRLELVARTLGCSQMCAFFKITLLLTKNSLLAALNTQ